MLFVRGNDSLPEESGQAVVLAPKRAAGEPAAPTRPSNILGIRRLLEQRAAAASGHTGRPRSESPPAAGQRRASPSYAPNHASAAAASSHSPDPPQPAAAATRPCHSDADSEDPREKARLLRARPAGSNDSFESDEAAQRRRAAALATSSSSGSEGDSRRQGGKHRSKVDRKGGSGRSPVRRPQHRSRSRERAGHHSNTDRDERRPRQHDHHSRRSSRSRSRSRSRHKKRDVRGDEWHHGHKYSQDDRGRGKDRGHRSSSSLREGPQQQHRHHSSHGRDRSRDRERRKGDRSRSRSRGQYSRSPSRSHGPQRGLHTQQQQVPANPRNRGGIGYGDVPKHTAARASAAAAAQDAADSIPGYAKMSALEKLKARTRLALQKADATAAAKAAAAELEEAEEAGAGGGAGSSRPWTRFVFDQHAELDEDAADRQQHLDAAVGMGGFNSLQSLASGIGVDRQGLTGGDMSVFDRDDVELAAGQGSFLAGAAQRRQRLQEAAHEAAIFGAPAAGGSGGLAVASTSGQLERHRAAAGALHGVRLGGGGGGAVWDAGHSQGLASVGQEDAGTGSVADTAVAAGAEVAMGTLLSEEVVAQKPLSWRERAALKRSAQ